MGQGGVGYHVRKAEEERAEREANEQGKLSGRQIKELITKGMALADATALAASMISFEDISQIADLQAQQRAAAAGTSEIAQLAAQHREDMTTLIEKARNRRPESYNGDFPHPEISSRNPDGYTKPVPPLKCEMHDGAWSDRDQKVGAIDQPFEADQLDKHEVRLLNLLQPGEYRNIENFEGETGTVRVVASYNDASGALTRLVIAYPQKWVEKSSQGRKKPALTKVLMALVGYEGPVSKLNAWLDEKEGVTVAA